MSSNNDNLSAFEALVDVAKMYVGAWVVGTALDQALAGGNTDEQEAPADFGPLSTSTDGDPATVERLSQVEDMRKQVEELKAVIDALPTQPEPAPPKLPEPPKLVVPMPEPVRRGSVEELNAAVLGYNVAARHLGLMVLAGGIDKRVARGKPEAAYDAISGVIYAAERLMLLGASLARKAESLAKRRKELKELATSSRAVGERLPLLLDAAEVIDSLLDD